MVVLRPALAAYFTYLYLRNARRSRGAACLGAFIYGFSLPFMVWAEHPHDNVFLMAPLALLAIDSLVRMPDSRRSAYLSLVFAAVVAAGHPESAFHVLSLSAAYALVQASRYRRRRPRATRFLALSVVWSGALALVFFLPQTKVILAGAAFRRASNHFAPAMPMRMMVGLLLPKYFVAGALHRSSVDVPWNLNESACYYGLAALALAAASLAVPRRTSRIPGAGFWLAVLAAIAALVFLAPRFAIFQEIPILGQTFHNRLTVLAGLAIAVLASYSCNGLFEVQRVRTSVVAALGGILGMILFVPALLAGRPAQNSQLFVAVGFLVACAGTLLFKRSGNSRIVALCVVEFADLWLAASRYHPLVPLASVYPPVEAVARLHAWEGQGRSLPLRDTFPPNSMSPYGLRDVRGYDAVESSQYLRARADLARWMSDAGVPDVLAGGFTPQTARLLPIFAVGELVLSPDMRINPVSLSKLGPDLKLAYQGPDLAIYRIADSPGRFQIIERIVPAAAEVLGSRHESVVEGISAAVHFAMAGQAELRVGRDDPERIEFATSSPGPFFVRISDSFDPGWSARLDGHQCRILRADLAFRGLFVPAGEHRFELTYLLPGHPWTGIVSMISLLAAVLTLSRGHPKR